MAVVKKTITQPPKPAAKKVAKEKPPKEEKFVPPKKLPGVADLLYTIRQTRLKLQHQLQAMKKNEKICEDILINKLPKGDMTGVAGEVARATIEVEAVAVILDEKKLMAYITKTGQTDLLQKPKLSKEAVQLRWAAKKTVPGVGTFNVVKVHLNKVK
jgi:hypothetical protein